MSGLQLEQLGLHDGRLFVVDYLLNSKYCQTTECSLACAYLLNSKRRDRT